MKTWVLSTAIKNTREPRRVFAHQTFLLQVSVRLTARFSAQNALWIARRKLSPSYLRPIPFTSVCWTPFRYLAIMSVMLTKFESKSNRVKGMPSR